MANLAQTVNVLQSVVLTDEEKMVLTPTYWVFYLYKVHQDATLLPISLMSTKYRYGDRDIDAVSVSASKDADGKIHITLVNADPDNEQRVDARLVGASVSKVSGKMLTSGKMNDYNSFEEPSKVTVGDFNGATLSRDNLTVTLPPKSVVLVELQ
jgi:alpha-N-arabinofuranosidase